MEKHIISYFILIFLICL